MNHYQYGKWTVKWEGQNEDFVKDNRFLLIDEEMDGTLLRIQFDEEKLIMKPGMVDLIEIDAENHVITVKAPSFDFDE